MAEVKRGRPKVYTDETPEEKALRHKMRNRLYQKKFQDKKREEREKVAMMIAKEEFTNQFEGGKE